MILEKFLKLLRRRCHTTRTGNNDFSQMIITLCNDAQLSSKTFWLFSQPHFDKVPRKKSKLMISLCTNFNARKRSEGSDRVFFWHKRFKTCNYPKAYMTLKRIIMLCTVAQTQEEGTWKRARQTSTITRITSQNPKIVWATITADFQFSLRSKVTQFCS